jgi:16S rRNA (adenine1518-N6/adenine1519-N6)-dimethyltransferase
MNVRMNEHPRRSPERGGRPHRARRLRTRQTARRPRIGQHFLIDPLVAGDIVRAADLGPETTVLEVGPGHGALTERLLERAGHVVAIELDERLALAVRQRFAGNPHLTVISESILNFAPDEFLAEAGRALPYVVVANLPYYITAPTLRHFLERGPAPQRLVVMVQREVARAIAPTKPDLSLLGVSVAVFAQARRLFDVPPTAFRPPPKVWSTVVRLDVHPEPLVPPAEQETFFKVVAAGFRAPRKQLHNALPSGGIWLPPGEGAQTLLREAGIDPMRRAATLSVDEWIGLYRTYARLYGPAARGRTE